jgi:hypothetical protein
MFNALKDMGMKHNTYKAIVPISKAELNGKHLMEHTYLY